MDLPAETTRLQLDLLAVRLGTALDDAGIPYALIKGPSTSLWLYDPPRRYSDVDLLVPLSRARDAQLALEEAGLAVARSGGIGEEASHSLLMHSTEGFEVDLHISLPVVPTNGDRVWSALAARREPLVMDIGTVTALDEVGRCLVLVLHAVANPGPGQALEDLIRSLRVATPASWASAADLGRRIGVEDLVAAGIALGEGREIPLSRRARLHLDGASAPALGIQRLLDAPRLHLPWLIWREAFPTRGFMAHAEADVDLRGRALVRAHVRRWRRLARQLPAALGDRRDPS